VSILSDSPLFASISVDSRLAVAIGIAALSGLVRGFSGFGSALIYMPLMAAVYDPRTAAVTLLLIDFVSATPFAIRALGQCTWREVLPIWIAAAVGIPFGTMALLVVDPTILRWFMALLVLALLAILMSGWRYRGEPRLPLTLGVGLFSGFGGGAVQIAGPAVIIYWLGGNNPAARVRANLLVFFLLTSIVLCVSYFTQGLFTTELIGLSILLALPFFVATAAGAHFFAGTSDQLYRRIAYLIIAVAAVISLPLLDPWLRW
jgi:uncharacterized protein